MKHISHGLRDLRDALIAHSRTDHTCDAACAIYRGMARHRDALREARK